MFSLKNGLKLTWAHLHNKQMLFAWITIILLPSIVALIRNIWQIGIIYFIIANIIYILVRCWDDPVELGWCES